MVAGSPFVVEERYGVSPQIYAFIFVACASGMARTTQLNGSFLR
jgi:hypothetical protein